MLQIQYSLAKISFNIARNKPSKFTFCTWRYLIVSHPQDLKSCYNTFCPSLPLQNDPCNNFEGSRVKEYKKHKKTLNCRESTEFQGPGGGYRGVPSSARAQSIIPTARSRSQPRSRAPPPGAPGASAARTGPGLPACPAGGAHAARRLAARTARSGKL